MQEDSQHTSDVGRHRRQESRTLAAADLQVVGVDVDKVVLHSLYIFQVDQITLVTAGKWYCASCFSALARLARTENSPLVV